MTTTSRQPANARRLRQIFTSQNPLEAKTETLIQNLHGAAVSGERPPPNAGGGSYVLDLPD